MDCLNLGCGEYFHPDWTNVDFTATSEGVITHNLREGLPFPDASFDVVYHSHVLEHFPKAEAPVFLQECFRVLRPQGILRVVIPDLEQIARLYLEALERASQGSQEWAAHYNWILLEMYDQTVRDRSGGGMASYLAADNIPNQDRDFVIQRLGREAKNLIAALQESRQEFSPVEIQLSDREVLLQSLLGDTDYQAIQIGRFRQSGEVHQWMYDRYSLSVLLENSGFEQIAICQADESRISNFITYGLDVEWDGQIRKPDSLFVEAIKPIETETGIEKVLIAKQRVISPPKDLRELPEFQAVERRVHQLQVELERSQNQFKQIHQQLTDAQALIAAMESSKFWKMRLRWIQFRQFLGFS